MGGGSELDFAGAGEGRWGGGRGFAVVEAVGIAEAVGVAEAFGVAVAFAVAVAFGVAVAVAFGVAVAVAFGVAVAGSADAAVGGVAALLGPPMRATAIAAAIARLPSAASATSHYPHKLCSGPHGPTPTQHSCHANPHSQKVQRAARQRRAVWRGRAFFVSGALLISVVRVLTWQYLPC